MQLSDKTCRHNRVIIISASGIILTGPAFVLILVSDCKLIYNVCCCTVILLQDNKAFLMKYAVILL